MKLLGDCVKACPKKAEQITNILLVKWRSEEEIGRIAVSQLMNAYDACPEKREQITDILLCGSLGDDDRYVEALRQFSRLNAKRPDLTEMMIRLAVGGVESTNLQVAEEAFKQYAALTRGWPDSASRIVTRLFPESATADGILTMAGIRVSEVLNSLPVMDPERQHDVVEALHHVCSHVHFLVLHTHLWPAA